MKKLDLTQGNVPGVLFQFALPYLLANMLQALYGGADLFVVGQFDDAASMAGVAIGSQVMQTVTGIILGLTTGITVLIGIATGARNDKENCVHHRFFHLAVCPGGRIPYPAHDLAPQSDSRTDAYSGRSHARHLPLSADLLAGDSFHYRLQCHLRNPARAGRLAHTALFCSSGLCHKYHTRLPAGRRFSFTGSESTLATIASQGISFLTALIFLRRRGFSFRFTRQDIRLNGLLSRRIVLLGAPIALQDALINISFLLITVIVNQMGVIASAALGVVEKIIIFAMLPPVAISSAVAAMTAQNFGAGLTERMNRCLKAGIGMALVFGVSMCLYSQFLPDTLLRIFTSDPAVITMGAGYLRGYSIDCIMVSFVFCFNSYFSGQGNSWFSMVHSLIATLLFRIPLSWAFSHIDPTTLVWMGYAPPLSTLVSLFICLWYLPRWKRNISFSSR